MGEARQHARAQRARQPRRTPCTGRGHRTRVVNRAVERSTRSMERGALPRSDRGDRRQRPDRSARDARSRRRRAAPELDRTAAHRRARYPRRALPPLHGQGGDGSRGREQNGLRFRHRCEGRSRAVERMGRTVDARHRRRRPAQRSRGRASLERMPAAAGRTRQGGGRDVHDMGARRSGMGRDDGRQHRASRRQPGMGPCGGWKPAVAANTGHGAVQARVGARGRPPGGHARIQRNQPWRRMRRARSQRRERSRLREAPPKPSSAPLRSRC